MPTIEELYPPLRLLASARLDDDVFMAFRQRVEDWVVFNWIQRAGVSTVGDLLPLTRDDMARWPAVTLTRADRVIELLGHISAEAVSLAEQLGVALAPPEDFDWDLGDRYGLDSTALVQGGSRTVTRPTGDADDVTVQERFPLLTQIAELELGSAYLLPVRATHDDELTLSWIRARSSAECIRDLFPLTRRDLLDWRGFGPTKVERILEFLGRLNDLSPSIASTKLRELPDRPAHEGLEPATPPYSFDGQDAADLETLASWAITIKGAETWGDVLDLVASPFPDDVGAALERIRNKPLANPERSLTLDECLNSLGERSRRILTQRAMVEVPATLADLATDLGLTRERVRQLEIKAVEAAKEHAATDPLWRSARWASEWIASHVGVAAPRDAVGQALPSASPEEQRFALWLAGLKTTADGFVVQPGFRQPTLDVIPRVHGTEFVVDEFALIEDLGGQGVLPYHVDKVIGRIPETARVDGQLVIWRRNLADRAVAVLELRDEPQSIDELHAAVGSGEYRSFRNRVFEDPRVMRMTKAKVGLRSWGGMQYTSIADLMIDRLRSGPRELEELSHELSELYEISAASVTMYAAAPIFKTIGGVVALRNRNEPYPIRNRPEKVKGLYRWDDHAIVLCLEVDDDILRGSGRSVPQEVAGFMGISPGMSVELDADRDTVRLGWSETSAAGPSIGSLKSIVERLGTPRGGHLLLYFVPSTNELRIRPQFTEPSAANIALEISAMTGLPAANVQTQEQLAAAVGVDVWSLDTALRRRGDVAVADLAASLP